MVKYLRKNDFIGFGLQLIISLLFLSLIIFLFSVFKSKPEELSNQVISIPAIRGTIYVQDKTGKLYPIALTEFRYDLYFYPYLSSNPQEDLKKLSNILKIDFNNLKIDNKNKRSILLYKNIDYNLKKKIDDLKLPSIFYETKVTRIYPYDNFLEPVLGFAVYNNQEKVLEGKYGLEKFYDEYLKGRAGMIKQIGGSILPTKGADLILNIDFYVQRESEKILEEAVKNYKAEGGLIVIGDLKNGSLIGIAEIPSYDPNKYNEVSDYSQFIPQLISNFEPGSVMKPITFLSALVNKTIKPEDTYNDLGSITIDNWTIKNFDNKVRGITTFRDALVQSLNVGLAQIALKLGKNRLLNTYQKLKLEDVPDIDLTNLTKPNYYNLIKKDFRLVNLVTASFGQGISLSPIKILEIYTPFALNGKMVSFKIAKEVDEINGSKIEIHAKNSEKIFNNEIWEEMKNLLEAVVEEQAKKAKIDGFRIAGKTGSAYIPTDYGYSDEVITSFVGFFPVSEPRFIVLVKLNRPEKGLLAFGTAAPTFKKIAEFLIKYYNLEPDI